MRYSGAEVRFRTLSAFFRSWMMAITFKAYRTNALKFHLSLSVGNRVGSDSCSTALFNFRQLTVHKSIKATAIIKFRSNRKQDDARVRFSTDFYLRLQEPGSVTTSWRGAQSRPPLSPKLQLWCANSDSTSDCAQPDAPRRVARPDCNLKPLDRHERRGSLPERQPRLRV
jgi:hypothetical protein